MYNENIYLIENKKYHIIDNEYKYYYLCLNNEFINLDIKINEIGDILKFSSNFEHFNKEDFYNFFNNELIKENLIKLDDNKKSLVIQYFKEKHFIESLQDSL